MLMKISEIIDRYTILELKLQFDSSVAHEFMDYRVEYVHLLLKEPRLVPHAKRLVEVNALIWEQEAAIRREYDNDPAAAKQLTLDEIGRRAIEIRKLNGKRVEAKTYIDRLCTQHVDPKVDHISDQKPEAVRQWIKSLDRLLVLQIRENENSI